jgi:uncharacterized protein (TIGR04206 family)
MALACSLTVVYQLCFGTSVSMRIVLWVQLLAYLVQTVKCVEDVESAWLLAIRCHVLNSLLSET